LLAAAKSSPWNQNFSAARRLSAVTQVSCWQ
jgi:hypothetical protein